MDCIELWEPVYIIHLYSPLLWISFDAIFLLSFQLCEWRLLQSERPSSDIRKYYCKTYLLFSALRRSTRMSFNTTRKIRTLKLVCLFYNVGFHSVSSKIFLLISLQINSSTQPWIRLFYNSIQRFLTISFATYFLDDKENSSYIPHFSQSIKNFRCIPR